MNKPTKIYLDMDDVLNHFTSYIGLYFGVAKDHKDLSWYNPEFNFDIYNAIKYAMESRGVKLRLNFNEFWDSLKEHHWACVPPTDGLQQLLDASVRLVGQQNVFVATAPTLCPYSLSGKAKWVQKHLPRWLHRQVHYTARKWELAAPGRLLIDDSFHNCTQWVESGGNAILINKPWNVNSVVVGDFTTPHYITRGSFDQHFSR